MEAVPRLQPELLHRVIQTCGLEDCGELVALATPDQLARVFDLDLWRAAQSGLDEQFDADRFGVWLEVLVERGARVAAQKLAGMDAGLITAGFAQHARVFDRAAITTYTTTDGEEVTGIRNLGDVHVCELGGYAVVRKRSASWEAIVEVLSALDDENPDFFHRVMRGCRALSSSRPEVDGLHDLLNGEGQVMFDLAFDRERRREKHGYVTPAQARAFLQTSRELCLSHDTPPPASPLAGAYFRAIDETLPDETSARGRLTAGSDGPPVPDSAVGAVAAAVEVLQELGIVAREPRALLNGSESRVARLARIEAHMQFLGDLDPDAYSIRSGELAYLSNAILAGCSIQARAFTAQEASDAALAVCNLGLENWPSQWLLANTRRASSVVEGGTALPDDFLVDHDFISVFQVGWAVLYRDVGLYAAERLIAVLRSLRCADREIQKGLDALRIEMTKHWRAGAPWRARDALDVLTALDMPAWAALLALIDECPVIHAGLSASRGSHTSAVSASAFEFISENGQIASIREFMEILPKTLSGVTY